MGNIHALEHLVTELKETCDDKLFPSATAEELEQREELRRSKRVFCKECTYRKGDRFNGVFWDECKSSLYLNETKNHYEAKKLPVYCRDKNVANDCPGFKQQVQKPNLVTRLKSFLRREKKVTTNG